MRLYLIRHAHAGDRQPDPRDIYRPLSSRGHNQAVAIADLLASVGVGRILSSPATRCVQTVEPLAERIGLAVEEQPDLWEETYTAHVLALLTKQVEPVIAACSHGNVIPEVIETITAQGTPSFGRGWAKGSIWILDHDGEDWTRATYLDRSATELPNLDALP